LFRYYCVYYYVLARLKQMPSFSRSHDWRGAATTPIAQIG